MDLTTARAKLAEYLQAESEVLQHKTATFQGRTITMENLPEIRAGRQEWTLIVANLEGRRRGPAVVEFCD